MPTPTVLDPREARPLTSREISKVLSGIIGGVVAANPKARDHVAGVVDAVLRGDSTQMVESFVTGLRPGHVGGNIIPLNIYPTWACAFSATVAGLKGWCNPTDVRTALHWVAENLNLVCLVSDTIKPAN